MRRGNKVMMILWRHLTRRIFLNYYHKRQ